MALRCFGESGFVTFDVVDSMSLIPGFSWRRGHCPTVLMECKKPFRLISERLFACRARFGFYASDVLFRCFRCFRPSRKIRRAAGRRTHCLEQQRGIAEPCTFIANSTQPRIAILALACT